MDAKLVSRLKSKYIGVLCDLPSLVIEQHFAVLTFGLEQSRLPEYQKQGELCAPKTTRAHTCDKVAV